ncbi:probable ergosterol biosynthetic protein 28 [Strongylocentrotus purpuratus]|uniref:Ergosterol biosynthetic protein 28 n=1 Tax=Strongylocentrotus purpuratus TaxID=7668 RepID=A0A7M7PT91_STRPU|nr:probable ergosterol biosynthetic protein 28 [Strongylocentrotus purpuratus]XP_030855386.1 probable ergosterol biosynthetic protein 28 [Strongylocentrotus purpuratus]
MANAFTKVLRFWIFLVGFMAVGTAMQAFMESSFLATRMYTQAQEMVNAVLGRLFGTWTLLAGAVRMMCSYDIRNRAVYDLTLFSFILAFLHFATEYLLFQTVELSFGVVSPLVISGVSIVMMLQGYYFVFEEDEVSPTPTESKKKK